MQPSSSIKGRKLFKVVFYAALLALPVVAWLNRYAVYDWVRLRTYKPPAEVQALAEKTTMTEGGQRLFYVNHPQIDSKEQLSADCRQDEISIVLGCFIAGKGIYLFNVSDPRLNGVEEVTAAHEMLHAGYDRLSGKEKDRVNKLLEEAFAKVDSPRIKETIEQYRKKDPGVVPNELHSILGTEVRNLPEELEDYYKQYFTNRRSVVGFSEQYESEFSTRQAKVKEYDAQLASLKEQITTHEAKLEAQAATIQAERARLNGLLSAKDYSAYNAGVESFNQTVNAYNGLASSATKIIEQYNTVVASRNALAVEVNDLAKAIDTRPQGIPAQ